MSQDSLKVKVYNQQGAVVGEQVLDAKIFGVEIKPEVVHQVVVAQAANSRNNLSDAKTRGEVNGGGRKPWAQKGTGRSRQGSIRSPQWKGGGVVFGPTSEANFSKSVNKKVKTKALFMCLTDKFQNEKLVIVDQLNLTEPKTKLMVEILKSLPNAGKKTLVVMENKNENLLRATKNIAKVEIIKADSLNVIDLAKAEYVLAPTASLEVIQKTYIKIKQ